MLGRLGLGRLGLGGGAPERMTSVTTAAATATAAAPTALPFRRRASMCPYTPPLAFDHPRGARTTLTDQLRPRPVEWLRPPPHLAVPTGGLQRRPAVAT